MTTNLLVFSKGHKNQLEQLQVSFRQQMDKAAPLLSRGASLMPIRQTWVISLIENGPCCDVTDIRSPNSLPTKCLEAYTLVTLHSSLN